MFNALFKVQWKWTRGAVLIATLFAFAVPMFSVRYLITNRQYYQQIGVGQVVKSMQSAGVMYSVLAAAAGLAVAFLAWSADHRGRHMYALSLPISRARYSMMRFGAGSLMLLLPATGVLLGCLIALGISDVPPGLHAYPLALTLRFLLSSFVSFAIFFAIAGSSQKAAAILLASLGAFLVIGVMLSAMDANVDLIGRAASFLFAEPGLLSVFTGRWMLIDV